MDKILCISTVIVAIFYQLLPVNSLSFTLSSGTTKCLKEELHKDVLVTGEYQLSEASQKTHLTVIQCALQQLNRNKEQHVEVGAIFTCKNQVNLNNFCK